MARSPELGAHNNQDEEAFNERIPSAPPSPFVGPVEEITREQFQHFKTNHTPSLVDSHKYALKDEILKQSNSVIVLGENGASSGSVPARLPTFHASKLEPWHSMVAFGACVRLCLHEWAKGCSEAALFLDNECALLISTLSLQHVFPQSVEEVHVNHNSSEVASTKPKKVLGKMKVEVGKVRMTPTGCGFSSIKVKTPKIIKSETLKRHLFNAKSKLSSGWKAVGRRIPFTRRVPVDTSLSQKTLAYRQPSSTIEVIQETYSCLLRLKSSDEMDTVRMQPGTGGTHIFLPYSPEDDLILEVNDSKGDHVGRVLVQVASILKDPNEKLKWWPIYRDPDHEVVGKIQLYIDYSTSLDDRLKCGTVAETILYDIVLEGALKVQISQHNNLILHGQWQWLLNAFASHYGVSDAYTKLRYLSYIMDVATPTTGCLSHVHDLLLPVTMKGHSKTALTHLENSILGEILEQIEQILAHVFENYKSLHEQSLSGINDAFTPATTGVAVAPPVLEPAVKLYKLVNDILSPKAQNKLYSYFKAAAKKRCRRHLSETDKYLSGNLINSNAVSTVYQKMKSLCLNIKNEIFTDIEIKNSNILPSFIDLPNISTTIYSTELMSRLRALLVACSPTGPSLDVTELVTVTADLQNDIASWNINPVENGFDAKELFDPYIRKWIQDKRLSLQKTCKRAKVKRLTKDSTTPFVDEMYDLLKKTMTDYEVILSRWPGYAIALEIVIVDTEKAVIKALDKQYADVITPLKSKKFGLKCFQKLSKRTTKPYVVPRELGIILNSMKRMIDVLRPEIELQSKAWGSCCIPDEENVAPGEGLGKVTEIFRSKLQNYIQAVVEKLLENTKLQTCTKPKKILQDLDSKESSDIKFRMKPLTDQLTDTMNHLYNIFETHVFIAICREYWKRMGQDILSSLENRKENCGFCFLGKRKEDHSWDKISRVSFSILDNTFESQMQRLLGNRLQEKDLKPPR